MKDNGFPARAREARDKAGLTQPEAAERIGVARPTISRYERGELDPSRAKVVRMAAVYGCDVGWLAGDGGKP